MTDQRAALRAAEDAQVELAYQATHDTLIGLVNRSGFERIASQRLTEPTGCLTVLFLDLDRFKIVNDSLGHAAGDALIVEIGGRLPPRPAGTGRHVVHRLTPGTPATRRGNTSVLASEG